MSNTEVVKIALIDRSGRYRKHAGELIDLCKSISAIGLLQPIVVTKEKKLVAGERRISAYERLGIEEIEAKVVDLDNTGLLRGEQDENICRQDFTTSERVAIGKAIEAAAKPDADKRMKAGKKPCENFTQGQPRTRDKAAAAVGLSGPTYEKAKAVVEAAEADPETFGPVVEEMDRTGKVAPAFARVNKAKSNGKPKPRGSFDATTRILEAIKEIEVSLKSVADLKPSASTAMRVIEAARDARKRLDRFIGALEKGV